MMRPILILAAAVTLSGCAHNIELPAAPTIPLGRIGPEADADRMQAASVRPGGPADEMPVAASQYLARAAMIDLYEVQAAQVALERSEHRHVRRYAQRMLLQHGRLARRRDERVERAGFNYPGVAGLDEAHALMITQLQTAPDIDRAYLVQQRRVHQAAFVLHTGYLRNGDIGRLRSEAGWQRRYTLRHVQQLSRLEQRVIRP